MNPRTAHKKRAMTRPRVRQPLARKIEADARTIAACERKTRYADEATARAAASIHLRDNTTEITALYAYHCPVCNGWHMTKRPSGLAITADDPFTGADAENEVLGMIRAGKATSYFNCPHAEHPDSKWFHATCLALEKQGKIRSKRVHARQIIWEAVS